MRRSLVRMRTLQLRLRRNSSHGAALFASCRQVYRCQQLRNYPPASAYINSPPPCLETRARRQDTVEDGSAVRREAAHVGRDQEVRGAGEANGRSPVSGQLQPSQGQTSRRAQMGRRGIVDYAVTIRDDPFLPNLTMQAMHMYCPDRVHSGRR